MLLITHLLNNKWQWCSFLNAFHSPSDAASTFCAPNNFQFIPMFQVTFHRNSDLSRYTYIYYFHDGSSCEFLQRFAAFNIEWQTLMHINALARKSIKLKWTKFWLPTTTTIFRSASSKSSMHKCVERGCEQVSEGEKMWTGKKCFQLYTKNFPSTKSRNKSENFCRNSISQN